jgi:hypothetical protein
MTESRAEWDKTYTAKGDTQVSWYQICPERSLALIEAAAPKRSSAIIDVGGGTSRLVDGLLSDGYSDLTVLDISGVALDRSMLRLGQLADHVSWIVADITQWLPTRSWDVWHDRAVFHFLTGNVAQEAYIRALRRGTAPGSSVIMATFALSGPERCSGLPVQRYSASTLADRLGSNFALYDQATEQHATPFGTTQDFLYAAFRRE